MVLVKKSEEEGPVRTIRLTPSVLACVIRCGVKPVSEVRVAGRGTGGKRR